MERYAMCEREMVVSVSFGGSTGKTTASLDWHFYAATTDSLHLQKPPQISNVEDEAVS